MRPPLHPDDSLVGQQGPDVSVLVRPRSETASPDVWQLFSDQLIQSVQGLGFRQPDVLIKESQPPPPSGRTPVVIAPGIMVRAEEYEERYGGIDLDGLKRRMTPAVFNAFVRHVGVIPGRPDLDVSRIVEIPE